MSEAVTANCSDPTAVTASIHNAIGHSDEFIVTYLLWHRGEGFDCFVPNVVVNRHISDLLPHLVINRLGGCVCSKTARENATIGDTFRN